MRLGERLKREPDPAPLQVSTSLAFCKASSSRRMMTGLVLTLPARSGGRDPVALLVSEDGQHVNGHGKTATGSHKLENKVTSKITFVNQNLPRMAGPVVIIWHRPNDEETVSMWKAVVAAKNLNSFLRNFREQADSKIGIKPDTGCAFWSAGAGGRHALWNDLRWRDERV